MRDYIIVEKCTKDSQLPLPILELWRIERSQEQEDNVKWLAEQSSSAILNNSKNVKPSELEILVADYP